jgi:disulfide bond formation protein DsbB
MSVAVFDRYSTRALALALALAAALALAGAFTMQGIGYRPCELCYAQRWAFYVGAPVALVAAAAPPGLRRALLYGLTALFLGNALLALYHSGVEWKLWAGPSACTGEAMPAARDMGDFMKQLETAQVVRCDEPALRILGLSMAGWNAVLCSGLAAAAFAVARRVRREA